MTKPMTQEQHFRFAEDRMHQAMHEFLAIQNGPNPITRDEVRRMVEKRPGIWGWLRGYADSNVRFPGRSDRG